MVSLATLWIPIVLSTVIVFIASSILHMVLPYHKSDYRKLSEEDKVMAALRAELALSRRADTEFKQGPVGLLTVFPSGVVRMGKFLGLWFVYCLIIGFFTAYLTGHTVAPGAHYPAVFRVAGTAAFMAYGLGGPSNGIWKGLPWSMVSKECLDGLIYGLLTAGTFGWLWPR